MFAFANCPTFWQYFYVLTMGAYLARGYRFKFALHFAAIRITIGMVFALVFCMRNLAVESQGLLSLAYFTCLFSHPVCHIIMWIFVMRFNFYAVEVLCPS